MSHDAINRYLRGERITPRLVWDNVRSQLVLTERGYLVFDDTVLDKNYSHSIELVRRQYSGNARAVIKGIGVVTCIYVNPETDQFWLIDYRIYDPEGERLAPNSIMSARCFKMRSRTSTYLFRPC